MFAEDLFDFVREGLAEEIAARPPMLPVPLVCDRWQARSALQKAVRRGDVEIAQSALATLHTEDVRAMWRHVVIIALEDVGVSSIDTLTRVVAASRNRAWRTTHGGDWAVASFLVSEMARGQHCQAACDLLMRVLNDPAWASARLEALDSDITELTAMLADRHSKLSRRAAAALALGGGLAEEQRQRQPGAVFEILSDGPSHVAATAHAAWKASGNPMAFLLPLVWTEWREANGPCEDDDPLAPAAMAGPLPGYALDRFTRLGGRVIRALIAADADLRLVLKAAEIAPGAWPATVGDALFVLEGGKVKRRVIWPLGDKLRLPHRPLHGVFALGHHLNAALRRVHVQAPLIARLRREYIHPANSKQPLQGRPVRHRSRQTC
jgi:hypothetical protein